MKQLYLILFLMFSSLCYAQEFTVSIDQLNYGKVAFLDQVVKPNDETTLNLCYIPKTGDYEYPTLVMSSPELFSILLGKNTIGYIDNLSLKIETSDGILHYFASRKQETLNIEHTNEGSSLGIIMFLAKVDLETSKFQLAKGTKAWSKKIKNILTNCIVRKITVHASCIYSTNSNKIAMNSKDSKYTINFSPDINMASLFDLLFKKGDAIYK